MSKENEYRNYAAKMMDLAQRASSTADKERLLMMTEAWLDLAARAHQAASRDVRKVRDLHPLIRARLVSANRELE